MRWGVLSTAQIGLNKVIPGMRKSPLIDVAAIASRNVETARAAADRCGIAQAYGSYEELLADPRIEAVYNPLPVHMHVDWSVRAMEAGKHVLCEKPIALSAAEAARLVDARERTGRQVLEAVMIRQHPQWLRAREIVREGGIGPLRLVQATMSFFLDDPANIRNLPELGGGALYDVGCYALYVSRFLFESEPVRAVALIDRDPDMGIDRLTGALVDFGGGRMLSFACGTQLARYQTVQVFGRQGRIEVPVSLNAPLGGETTITVDRTGGNDPAAFERETLPACDQYMLQGETAVRAFRGDEPAEFPIEDAVAGIAAIDALYRSAESGAWEEVTKP